MQRFFLPEEAFNGEQVRFTKAASHQIVQVLRMSMGRDKVAVIDPEGRESLVRLMSVQEGLVQGLQIGPLPANEEAALRLCLCFSLSRREKVELILQKCTEIGVAAFQPYVSSRSLVQECSLEEKKQKRLETIVQEACEQAHRQHIPQIQPALPYEALLKNPAEGCQKLLAWEEAENCQRLNKEHIGGHCEPLYLLIGPEGGLSEDEASLAEKAGWQVISLGKSILRMETACIAAAAIAIYLGEEAHQRCK
ncbi:MAG: RsmE family RNA methyltransferase [Anaerolineaceae bacterium]|nr:RsmE family RNA methyltransferase [Anaerolineaceae bacterium]